MAPTPGVLIFGKYRDVVQVVLLPPSWQVPLTSKYVIWNSTTVVVKQPQRYMG